MGTNIHCVDTNVNKATRKKQDQRQDLGRQGKGQCLMSPDVQKTRSSASLPEKLTNMNKNFGKFSTLYISKSGLLQQ